MLARREIDVAVADVRITKNRGEVVDYLIPTSTSPYERPQKLRSTD